ncbi:unnamed protein product [Effrenium voratum]|nr:unnamed protein product [Effrenium voratum]
MREAEQVFRVLLVAGMSALLPNLKGGSLSRPHFDALACHDAAASGASCQVCETKFKLCKGHYVYEPFTVVLFEAILTVLLGVLATFLAVSTRRGVQLLLDWRSVGLILPVGAIYAVGDLMDLAAARSVSGTTLLVAAQLRLPLCALLRWVLLRRGQSALQWLLLLVISLLCVGHVVHDLGDTVVAGEVGAEGSWIAASADELLRSLPLILGKCIISCGGAVHAEYFLQHSAMPLWVTQVHFKFATILGALAVAAWQGRRGGRIFASTWDGHLFSHLPPSTLPGDPRVPFFGGWDGNTWILAACLILNNFLVAEQMRKLTSVSKYVAYAFGLVMSYLAQLYEGRGFRWEQAASCLGIALAAVAPRLRWPGVTCN